MSTHTDAEIIASSLEDAEVFTVIFDRYFSAILAYLSRRVRTADAQDLASETFLIAFRRRTSYDVRQESARAWLFGIAANLLRHHYRSETRRLRAFARIGTYRPAETGSEEVDSRLESETIMREVARALATLRPKDREVLLLHAWANLTYSEIADALGIPVGTVRSRLFRARRRIRELPAVRGQSTDEEVSRRRRGDG